MRNWLVLLLILFTFCGYKNLNAQKADTLNKLVLINKNYKGFFHALFNDQWKKSKVKIGQKIKYKRNNQTKFQKAKIDAIGDSSLVTMDGNTVGYKELKALAFTTTQQRVEIVASIPFLLIGATALSFSIYAVHLIKIGSGGLLELAFLIIGVPIGSTATALTIPFITRNKKVFYLDNWRLKPAKENK